MKISELYPSKYIKAANLATGPKTFTVKSAAMEQVGPQQEQKVVLRFNETPSAFIVNKTNSQILAQKLGDDFDTWPGHTITLRAATGKNHEGDPYNTVTVVATGAKASNASNGAATTKASDDSDDVPF